MSTIMDNVKNKAITDTEYDIEKSASKRSFKTDMYTAQQEAIRTIKLEQKSTGVEIDPYAKPSSKKINKTQVKAMTDSTYNNKLLEKILASQVKPEFTQSTIEFQNKTIGLLTDIKTLLDKKFNPVREIERKEQAERQREVSSLAKNISSLNVGGVMGDIGKAFQSDVDQFGLMGLAGSIKEMIVGQIESGGFKDTIKDMVQNQFLNLLGSKNKSRVERFKDDPVALIQDFINAGALSNNRGVRVLANKFYKGSRTQGGIVTNKIDFSKEALFDVQTHQSINRVIPNALERIVSAIEGTELRQFDHETGEYKTALQMFEKANSGISNTKTLADISSEIKGMLSDVLENNRSAFSNNFVMRNEKGEILKENGKVVLKNEKAFADVLKNMMLKSDVSIRDILEGESVQQLSKRGLSTGMEESDAISMIMMMQEVFRKSKVSDIEMLNTEVLDSKHDLGQIEKNADIANFSQDEIRLMQKLRLGEVNKKQYDLIRRSMYSRMNSSSGYSKSTLDQELKKYATKGKDTDGNDWSKEFIRRENTDSSRDAFSWDKNLYGDIGLRKSTKSVLDNGIEIDKELEKRLNSEMMKNAGLKTNLDYNKFMGAKRLFAKFASVGVTVPQMVEMTGKPPIEFKQQGYFSTFEELMPFMKDDGEVDMDKLKSHSHKYSDGYMKALNIQYKKSKSSSLEFSITDPMSSMNEIVNDVFQDPAILKKLSIGSGGAAGLALGKLLNNRTFIKSPMAGYILGSVGAGIMSMERTQTFLTNMFGSDEKTSGGASNREIFMAKLLTKWLPSAGVGMKTAGIVTRALSGLGPVGAIAGPVLGLAAGGIMAAVTPGIINLGRDKLFNDENDGEDEGVLRKVGKAIENIPGVSKFFQLKDKSRDAQIAKKALGSNIKRLDERIDVLRNTKNPTENERNELAALINKRKQMQSDQDYYSNRIENKKNEATRAKDEESFISRMRDTYGTDFSDEYDKQIEGRDKRNNAGSIANLDFEIRDMEERSKSFAAKEILRFEKDGKPISDNMSDKDKSYYETLKQMLNGEDINDLNKEKMKEVLEKMSEYNDHVRETMGSSNTLADNISAEEYDRFMALKDGDQEGYTKWFDSLSPDSKEAVNNHKAVQDVTTKLTREMYDNARAAVLARDPSLEGPKLDTAIEQYMKGLVDNGFKVKEAGKNFLSRTMNKFLQFFGDGGTDKDTEQTNTDIINKMASFNGVRMDYYGDNATKQTADTTDYKQYTDRSDTFKSPNNGRAKLLKMSDLKGKTFRDGQGLDAVGCGIVAMNNALAYLKMGYFPIDNLLEIAESGHYISGSGIATSFFKAVAKLTGIKFEVYGDGNDKFGLEWFNSQGFALGSKTAILLIENANALGTYHFVNFVSIKGNNITYNDTEGGIKKNKISNMTESEALARIKQVVILEKEKVKEPTKMDKLEKSLNEQESEILKKKEEDRTDKDKKKLSILERAKSKIAEIKTKLQREIDENKQEEQNKKDVEENKKKADELKATEKPLDFYNENSPIDINGVSDFNTDLGSILRNEVLNVRIVDDLTLGIKTGDETLHDKINRIKSKYNTSAKEQIKTTQELSKSPEAKSASKETEKLQDLSTAFYAQGTGMNNTGVMSLPKITALSNPNSPPPPPSEPGFFGKIGAFLGGVGTKAMGVGSKIASVGSWLLPAIGAGWSVKDGFSKMKDVFTNDAKANTHLGEASDGADRSGNLMDSLKRFKWAKALGASAKEIFTNKAGEGKSFVSKAKDKIKSLTKKTAEETTEDALSKIAKEGGNKAGSKVAGAIEATTENKNVLKDLLGKMWDGVVNKFNSGADWLQTARSKCVGFLKAPMETLFTSGKKMLDNILNLFQKKIKPWFNKILDVCTKHIFGKQAAANIAEVAMETTGKKVGAKMGKKIAWKTFKKGFKASVKQSLKSIPVFGNAMFAIGGFLTGFIDGYNDARYYMNNSELGTVSRALIGLLKGLYDAAPDIIVMLMEAVGAGIVAVSGGTALVVGGMLLALDFLTPTIRDLMFGSFQDMLHWAGISNTKKVYKDLDTGKYVDEKDLKEDGNYSKEHKLVDKDSGKTVDFEKKGGIMTWVKDKWSNARNRDKGIDKTQPKDTDAFTAVNKDGTSKYRFTKDDAKNDRANMIADYVFKHAKEAGVDPYQVLGQWAQESGWGGNGEVKGNAFFGIKAGKNWKGKTVDIVTHEVVTQEQFDNEFKNKGFTIVGKSGSKLRIKGTDKFRAYDSMEESVKDYMQFIKAMGYDKSLDGYATDPNYKKSVGQLMGQFQRGKDNYDSSIFATQSKLDKSNTSGGINLAKINTNSSGITKEHKEYISNIKPTSSMSKTNPNANILPQAKETHIIQSDERLIGIETELLKSNISTNKLLSQMVQLLTNVSSNTANAGNKQLEDIMGMST